MRMLYCRRCKTEVPMLDEEEFAKAAELYTAAFKQGAALERRFEPLLSYYIELTGWEETNPGAIMHHRIAQYGSACKKCHKPYRTPQASFCAACGDRPAS